MNIFEQSIIGIYIFLNAIQFSYSLNLIYLIFRSLKSKNEIKKIKKITDYPIVTIQLPTYNEKYVVKRLIENTVKMDWPKNKLEIQILDDSTDETKKIIKNIVSKYSKKRFNINHITRKERIGFKAGALQNGLNLCIGEYIAIFDADFIPQPDFLKKTIPHFSNDKIGFVQTRWGYANKDQSILTKIQSVFLDGHFGIEQSARYNGGHFFGFNGTAGIWRKKTIIDAEGWQHDTLTEDLDLSYRSQLKGWKSVYVKEIVTPSELPASVNAYRRQQKRWTMGSVECAMKLSKKVVRSNMKLSNKIQTIYHLFLSFFSVVFLLIILMFPIILYLSTKYKMLNTLTIYSSVLILFSFIPSTYFKIARMNLNKKKKNSEIFLASLLGSGFLINTVHAVFSALFLKNKVFERTPKYGSNNINKNWTNKKYQIKFSPVLKFEILFFIYLIFTFIYSIKVNNFIYAIYTLMFIFGTSSFVGYSIYQSIKLKASPA